ncbi:MAG: hypothetical protein LBE36_04490 [Flavobacteriaceae bacterium]|jgi:hypothetical protein|nr:hypothetical protein [Flavobacteriaceae bacterium]
MTDIEVFYELKKNILSEYRKHYPYFKGDWSGFGSKDIQNLTDLISENQKENVSEKWIYTHLKPETNDKLPRKDMLDIFSKFAGYSGWSEFHHLKTDSEKTLIRKSKKKSVAIWVIPIIIISLALMIIIRKKPEIAEKEISIKNSYTGKEIPKNEIKIYEINKDEKKEISAVNSKIALEKDSVKIAVESPFYETQTVKISEENPAEILLKPKDNAMMLKAFLSAEIKDWQTRKQQLETILSENTEVLLMLKNNLGTEYFNKEDFIKQILIPTERTKTWNIVELKSDESNKINFIRITEE